MKILSVEILYGNLTVSLFMWNNLDIKSKDFYIVLTIYTLLQSIPHISTSYIYLHKVDDVQYCTILDHTSNTIGIWTYLFPLDSFKWT